MQETVSLAASLLNVLSKLLELFNGFLSDDGLVHQHVAEDGTKRVLIVFASHTCLRSKAMVFDMT